MNKSTLRDVHLSQLMIDPHMTNVKDWNNYKIKYLKIWRDAIKEYADNTNRAKC